MWGQSCQSYSFKIGSSLKNFLNKKISEIPITFIAANLGQGGAERQLFYMLKTLRNSGYRVTLISLDRGQYWEKPILELGIPVFYPEKSENRVSKLWAIVKLARKINPTIIQSQHFHANFYAAIAGGLLGIPSVGAIRNDGVSEVEKTGRILGKICLHSPKYLAANSMVGLKYAANSGITKNRLRFLSNVIDTNKFSPAKKLEPANTVQLILVSNLWFPDKRVELFIQALGELRNRTRIPISAKIVGEGPLKTKLMRVGEISGVYPEMVEFLGARDDVENLYKQADILILTSDREGTPNVIMEAMASGLPVIATRVGGVPELVQDGVTGYLTEPGNLNELVEKMKILVENRDLRLQMGCLGRDYIMTNHSLERLPEILNSFYSSLYEV